MHISNSIYSLLSTVGSIQNKNTIKSLSVFSFNRRKVTLGDEDRASLFQQLPHLQTLASGSDYVVHRKPTILERIPQWIALDPAVKRAKAALNIEFGEKALLKNRVLYLEYPDRVHSHFKVEHTECFTSLLGWYSCKKHYKHKGSIPVRQFSLHVTPNELKRLNAFLNSSQYSGGLTCSDTAAAILENTTAIKIPFPLSLTATLSSWYLHRKKQQGWSRIGDITMPLGEPSRVRRIAALFCEAALVALHLYHYELIQVVAAPVIIARFIIRFLNQQVPHL